MFVEDSCHWWPSLFFQIGSTFYSTLCIEDNFVLAPLVGKHRTREKIKIHVSWKRLSFIKETSLPIWSHFSLNPTKKLQSVWGEIFRQCHSSASYILRSPVWIEKDLEYFLMDHLIAMASLNWKESRIFSRGSFTRI